MTVPEKKQMNAGVELLLKRMETHPEEFNGDGREGAKWHGLIETYKRFLNDDDRDALEANFNKLQQQRFTEKVLEGLVDPKPSTKLEELLSIKRQNATLSAGVTPVRSSVTLNANPYETEEMKNHLRAHIEAVRKEHDAVVARNKQHKTVFGRLHDYFGNL